MPQNRPFKRGVHIASASKVVNHGQLIHELGFVGVVVKQAGYTLNTARSAVAQVQVGEQYFLLTEGEVETPFLTGAVVGSPVNITTADNTLHLGAPGAGQVKVGMVTRLPGTYGMPSTATGAGTTPVIPAGGLMMVDLNRKDAF